MTMVVEYDLNRREEAERAVLEARRSLARARAIMTRSRALLSNVRAGRAAAETDAD